MDGRRILTVMDVMSTLIILVGAVVTTTTISLQTECVVCVVAVVMAVAMEALVRTPIMALMVNMDILVAVTLPSFFVWLVRRLRFHIERNVVRVVAVVVPGHR